jgi:hypothetical protein
VNQSLELDKRQELQVGFRWCPGTVCMDRYEASVWWVPNPTTTNAALVRKIQLGKATWPT